MRSLLLGCSFLAFAAVVLGQAPTPDQRQVLTTAGPKQPRGMATDVSNADIMAAVQKTAASATSDQALRVVSINNEYNVSIGVVHRARRDRSQTGGAIEHSQITEVYHVISGNGTLVTGGTIQNPTESAPASPVVTVLNGPSTGGSSVQDGVSRTLGPGDVVIIPPNTPHWFTEITSDQIVYLVVRMDPHKVLPAGYVLR